MSREEKGQGIVALLQTTEYRGDRSDRVTRVYVANADETVGELLARCFTDGDPAIDWLELRLVFDPTEVEF